MNRTSKLVGTLAALTTMGAALVSLQPAQAEDNGHAGRTYAQTNLVSDVPGLAKVTATVAGKTVYRAQVTGFAGQGGAIALCDELKAGGQACFVRP